MLHLLDEALEGLFRAGLPFDRQDVDVDFEPPTADWAAALTRPTVNLYLWGVTPSSSGAEAGMELLEHEGRLVRRPALPRIDCSYLVTAWATEPSDEHQLLSALLAIALTNAELPDDHLPAGLAAVRPAPRLSVTKGGDDRRIVDVWSAMGGRLRPAVDLVVSAPLAAALLTQAGPPVTAREVVVTAGQTTDTRRVVATVNEPGPAGAG